jgi:flagellar motor protein MotB
MWASLALAMVMAGTGCASNKTNAQLDGALSQNEQLKKELDAERRARQEADARANMAAAQATTPTEVSTPSMEPSALDLTGGAPGVTPRPGRTTPVGIESANGVTSSTNARGEVELEISGDVLFDSGKATLKPTAKRALDSVANTLKSRHASQQIRIEGHTDPAPVKKTAWDDNWDLGAARANAVRSYLTEKGVKNMYIASFASTELKNSRNQALNRRVRIVVVQSGR